MIVLFGSEKGGTGKSTLTQNMAAVRASLNYKTVVFDLDRRQATTGKWAVDRQENESLAKVAIELLPKGADRDSIADFGTHLQRLLAEYDDVFLEVGGKDSDMFRAAMTVADKTIVPLVPSPADLNTVPDLGDLVRAYKKPLDIRVVLNMASGAPKMLRLMREGIAEFGDVLPLVSKTVGYRVAFKYAMAAGKGVHELTSKEGFDANAANEIKDLYLEIFGK
jgi:chromosome partitioning protein